MALLRCGVVVVVAMVSLLDTTTGVLTDPRFATPLRKPSETVNALLRFVINKQAGTCHLVAINGLPVNRTYHKSDKSFQIPEISLCVYFRCRKKGVVILYKKSGCQYGDKCVNKVPPVEGRTYYCLINLGVESKVKVKEPGEPPKKRIDYRFLNGFVATPAVGFLSTFDKKTRTCTIYNKTVLRGESIDVTAIPGMDPCAVITCGKKGLQYQPQESACSVEGVGCRTTYERACTLFTCTRAVLVTKAKKGKAASTIINSWMRRNLPTCKYDGECVSMKEVVGTTDDPPCSHLACLEGEPGLPEILPSHTGCQVELLGPGCIGLGETAGHLVPVGPPGGPENVLDDDTCVEYLCKAHTSDPYRPVQTFLEPDEYGCRDEQLAQSLPDTEEPFGCFRQGVITERNCTRVKCVFVDGIAGIMSKHLMGRCVDETGRCRFPGEQWDTGNGFICVCNLGGGEPSCMPGPM